MRALGSRNPGLCQQICLRKTTTLHKSRIGESPCTGGNLHFLLGASWMREIAAPRIFDQVVVP
eukprot:CAMPEP_0204212416 /NCGR_PEP_ID=MMETSP0361-20130328/75223_1 /ASSEMBLY_ACC=CAM_ASM_000343 /TAXON_ID=268821 /ORGANISM="Scrippsiella Hangoei, Strain SHTV-5" /LENGTH=62 /DNA_ID=CAMNT_0051176739 /DNA_START=7 /DNA_END=192 /DNA_ORIENTATION=+